MATTKYSETDLMDLFSAYEQEAFKGSEFCEVPLAEMIEGTGWAEAEAEAVWLRFINGSARCQ